MTVAPADHGTGPGTVETADRHYIFAVSNLDASDPLWISFDGDLDCPGFLRARRPYSFLVEQAFNPLGGDSQTVGSSRK